MTSKKWLCAGGDRLVNPDHVEQIKQIDEKIVFTMSSGDTRTFHYDTDDDAARRFDDLTAFLSGLDIAGEPSGFGV